MTPRFRLSYNFSNSRATQNTHKKGKASNNKTVNGQFIKDVIFLGEPDQYNFPWQVAPFWLIENGHVVAGAAESFVWFFEVIIPVKTGSIWRCWGVDVGSLSLNGSCLAPGQTFSGFMLQKVFKDKPVYIWPMREILPMEPSFRKAKRGNEVSTWGEWEWIIFYLNF